MSNRSPCQQPPNPARLHSPWMALTPETDGADPQLMLARKMQMEGGLTTPPDKIGSNAIIVNPPRTDSKEPGLGSAAEHPDLRKGTSAQVQAKHPEASPQTKKRSAEEVALSLDNIMTPDRPTKRYSKSSGSPTPCSYSEDTSCNSSLCSLDQIWFA